MDLTKLKDLREKKNMTQVEVCKRIGVSVNAYRLWESGTSQPNEDNLEKLKKVLGINKTS